MALLKSLIPSPFAAAVDIETNGGTLVNFTDGNVVVGRSGNAALITGNQYFRYPCLNNFNFVKGAIRVWIKPTLDYRRLPLATSYLFAADWNVAINMYLRFESQATNGINTLDLYWGTHARSTEPYYGIMSIVPDTWNLIEVYWDLSNDVVADNFVLMRVNDKYSDKTTGHAKVTPGDATGNLFIGVNKGGAYSLTGVIDSFDIYSDPTDIMLVSPFPQSWWDRADYAGSLATLESLYADGDGFCKNWQTNVVNPTDCPLLGAGIEPTKDLIFFKRPHLQHVYPGYVPTEADIAGPYTWKGAAGEIETLFFNAYSRLALTNVVLTRSAFTGPGTIPAANVDIRVVYNWFQGGPDAETTKTGVPAYVGELLLKTDTYQLEADPLLTQWECPTLTASNQVDTVFAAGPAKQFCLIIDVPSDAVPGVYTGTVNLVSAPELVDETLTISFEVLPFALKTPSGMCFAAGTSLAGDTWYADPARMNLDIMAIFQSNMQEAKRLGFNCVYLSSDAEGEDDYWQRIDPTKSWLDWQKLKIDICASVGIERIFLRGTQAGYDNPLNQEEIEARYTQELVDYMIAAGYAPEFYGIDELGAASFSYQAAISTRLHSLEGNCKCYVTTSHLAFEAYNASYPVETDHVACVDGIILSRNSEYPSGSWNGYWAARQAGALSRPDGVNLDSIYWQSRDGDSRYHRQYMGFFPYLAGANSVTPLSIKATMRDFTDFDRALYRAYGFIYPAIDEADNPAPIPTFQGQAVREGVRDLKYLTTWQYYYDRVKTAYPNQASDSQDAITAILANYKDVVATSHKAGVIRDEADWDTDREAIIAQINYLRGYDSATTGRRSVIGGVITAMFRRFRKIGGVSQ